MAIDQGNVAAHLLQPVAGVRAPARLKAVADADLGGPLHDSGLDAVVATLQIACSVPIAVVNIVTIDRQAYAAEIGVGTPCTSVPDALSFCAEVVNSGDPLQVSDAFAHPIYSHNPLVLAGVVGAYAGEPLVDDGYVVGTVSIFDDTARQFTAAELEILRHQALLASSVLALRRSARTDFLTGLPNRALFNDRLSQALSRLERQSSSLAVIYLDIDDFKLINDAFGHNVGDGILAELAHRLTAVIRPTDTLARFGGDEFAAICESLGSAADVGSLAARMIATTDAPWVVQGQLINVAVSVGIALTDSHLADPAVLLGEADAAMYRAKHRPGSAWVLSADDRSELTSIGRPFESPAIEVIG